MFPDTISLSPFFQVCSVFLGCVLLATELPHRWAFLDPLFSMSHLLCPVGYGDHHQCSDWLTTHPPLAGAGGGGFPSHGCDTAQFHTVPSFFSITLSISLSLWTVSTSHGAHNKLLGKWNRFFAWPWFASWFSFILWGLPIFHMKPCLISKKSLTGPSCWLGLNWACSHVNVNVVINSKLCVWNNTALLISCLEGKNYQRKRKSLKGGARDKPNRKQRPLWGGVSEQPRQRSRTTT